MKKFYLIALFAFVCNFAFAQFEQVSYRGAFAPAPTAMWTDSWTNWDPKNTAYNDEATVVNVTADITANTTWVAGVTYKLTGLIYVRNNAVLTIQPGVVVKGNFTTSGTALIVTKGAKLNAIGTASQPIVFTSGKTVAQGRNAGDWGGIVLLGKARFSATTASNTGVSNIEGITTSVNTEYGGGGNPDDADSSGTLKYVRIEFGGYVFSNNNEINGLTMGAVGSGTTIDYVQTSYTNDDSFEWFGGSVNCKHLVAFRGLDDDFDTDNGYKGSVQFALAIKDPGIADNPVVSTSEGFESDNNPAGVTVQTGWDNTSAVFSNCTLIGPSGRGASSVAAGHERPLRLRRGTQLKIYNSIFMDFRSNYLFVDGALAQTNATQTTPTLKFQNNIIAGVPSSTYIHGVRGASSTTATSITELQSWFTTNNNTYTTSAGILSAPYSGTPLVDYTGDFRPGTLASTGALFTDSSIAALVPQVGTGTTPIVVNRTHCKGATGLAPLSAQLTSFAGDSNTAPFTGVSLRWYTSATTPTFTTVAPIPTSGTVGVKTFFVAQVDASNNVSARVPLTVTIFAAPTVGLGPITGTLNALPASTSVGLYLGTTTQFVYSVAASAEAGVTSYLWTVPSGVNIVSGQGTNSITVNYQNVPAGPGFVGTIFAQAVNTAGCPGVASKLTIKKSLAAAPALKMFDVNSAKPTAALTSFGQFAGTTTPVTLTATNVLDATGYQWELPAGVTPVFGGVVPVTSTATFTAEPFLAPTTAPTTIGTKFWVVTYNTYNGVNVNGVATKIVSSTAVQRVAGNFRDYTFTVTAGSTAAVNDVFTYNGGTYTVRTALTATGTSLVVRGTGANLLDAASTTIAGVLTKVSDSSTINFTRIQLAAFYGATTSAPYLRYGTVITSDKPSIIVSFAGVTAPTATEMYLGVKSLNGVGASVFNNNTAANASAIANNVPGINYNLYTEVITPAALPVAPSALGVNATSTYIAATPATTPSTARLLKVVSVTPAAPASIKSLDGLVSVTNISAYLGTTNPLTLTCSAVANASSYTWNLPAGVTQLTGGTTNTITVNYAGVASGTAAIVIGVTANNNVGSSPVKNATLTAGVPSTPAAPTGTLAICPSAASNVVYTVPVLATRATSYLITPPAGASVNGDTIGAAVSIPAVTGATFTVNYPSGFLSPSTASLFLNIASVNGFGANLLNRVLKLTNTGAVCGPRVAASNTSDFSVVAYPNPSESEFTIDVTSSAKGAATSVKVYDMTGRLVESRQSNTNSLQVGRAYQSGVYSVIVSNGSEVKTLKVIKK